MKNELNLIKALNDTKNKNPELIAEKLNGKGITSNYNEEDELKRSYEALESKENEISICLRFATVIQLFLDNCPLYSTKPYSKDEILCLAHTCYDILFSLGTKNLLANFKIFIDEMSKRIDDVQENLSSITFLLSNFIEIKLLFLKKYNLLQELPENNDSEFDMNIENVENLFLHSLELQKETLDGLLPYSILDYHKSSDQDKFKLSMALFSTPSITNLINNIEYCYDLSHYFFLPDIFILNGLSYILSHIDKVCFNALLSREKPIALDKCYHIQYNLSEIEKFFFNINFRDGFLNITNFSEGIRLLTKFSQLSTEIKAKKERVVPVKLQIQEIFDSTFLEKSQLICLVRLYPELNFDKKIKIDKIEK